MLSRGVDRRDRSVPEEQRERIRPGGPGLCWRCGGRCICGG